MMIRAVLAAILGLSISVGANAQGFANTVLGDRAFQSNTTGGYNTAVGMEALQAAQGGWYNTALGAQSLYSSTSGYWNSALGSLALSSNTTGVGNTAVGICALNCNTTGSYNIAIGSFVGQGQQTGDRNIHIGADNTANESGTLRIGSTYYQTRAFISGIRGITPSVNNAIPVVIDSNGQLGTISSSIRFKEDVRDMGDRTNRLYDLRPVTFRYKSQSGGDAHFGLIAEEVEKVMPELVVRGRDGQIETVAYHELAPMLLNELQKQKQENDGIKAEMANLKRQMEALLQRINP